MGSKNDIFTLASLAETEEFFNWSTLYMQRATNFITVRTDMIFGLYTIILVTLRNSHAPWRNWEVDEERHFLLFSRSGTTWWNRNWRRSSIEPRISGGSQEAANISGYFNNSRMNQTILHKTDHFYILYYKILLMVVYSFMVFFLKYPMN